jgi:hypothetical protein
MRKFAVAFLLCAVAGCATLDIYEDLTADQWKAIQNRTVDRSADETFNAVVAAFNHLGVPISLFDREQMVAGSQWFGRTLTGCAESRHGELVHVSKDIETRYLVRVDAIGAGKSVVRANIWQAEKFEHVRLTSPGLSRFYDEFFDVLGQYVGATLPHLGPTPRTDCW